MHQPQCSEQQQALASESPQQELPIDIPGSPVGETILSYATYICEEEIDQKSQHRPLILLADRSFLDLN